MSETVAEKREHLLWYFGKDRTDLPRLTRDQIIAKITSASDMSIRTDRPCVGKHWFLMSADRGRDVCPYCDLTLTLRRGPA